MAGAWARNGEEADVEQPPTRLVAVGPRELDRADTVAVAPAAVRITGTMLADIVRCEERVRLDLHGNAEHRAQVSGFVELLWSQGNRHEDHIIAALPGSVADLRDLPMTDRANATVAAMDADAEWILGGRLVIDDLEGRPDLLHRVGGNWFAGDIKSGSAWAQNGATPRLEYGVQVAFYTSLLERLELGAGDRAFVIGSGGEQSWYDLHAPFGRDSITMAGKVASLIVQARAIRDRSLSTRPALSSACGLCVWRSTCKERLKSEGDLTLVPGLGRSNRAEIEKVAPTVAQLAELDISAISLPRGRTSIAGIGAARLNTFRERARMLVTGAPPFAIRDLGLARRDVEHHLDLETDPTCETGDLTYLHGIWRRRRVEGVDTCDYVHFLADDPTGERDAFAGAIEFLTEEPDALLTTFSAFERTTYRRLAIRYPDVIDEARVEALFAPGKCVDLYFDAALPLTHWPVNSLGLKSLARYLGFDWSAADASGAASIQWYVDWARTRDPALLDRILTYNMQDCIASSIVFDGMIALPVVPQLAWPRQAAAA